VLRFGNQSALLVAGLTVTGMTTGLLLVVPADTNSAEKKRVSAVRVKSNTMVFINLEY